MILMITILSVPASRDVPVDRPAVSDGDRADQHHVRRRRLPAEAQGHVRHHHGWGKGMAGGTF